MTPFVKGLPNLRQLLERAEERIKRLKATVTALLILLVCITAFGAVQYARLLILQQEIMEGNQTACDDGYVAKIVDGSKVTCVMRHLGPAMVAHKVEVRKGREANYKRVSLTKEENKNENRDKDCNRPSVLDNWQFDGWVRKPSVCANTARSLQQRPRCGMQNGGIEGYGECRNGVSSISFPSLRYDSQ